MTDETLMRLISGASTRRIEALEESEYHWHLGTFSIMKRSPKYSDGFVHDLRPESCFYKRWFDFPAIGKRGWAIMFHTRDPAPDHDPKNWTEQFPGWVPPERVRDADRWIEFLNREIRDRLSRPWPPPRANPDAPASGGDRGADE